MTQSPLTVKILEKERAIVSRELSDNKVGDTLNLLVPGARNLFESEAYSGVGAMVRLCGEVSSVKKFCELEVLGVPEYLPFQQESFQAVIAPHTLENVDNPQLVLSEAVRVLEPEGYLLVTGYNALGVMGLYRSVLNSLPGTGASGQSQYIAPARLLRSMPTMGLRVTSCSYITVTSFITPNIIKSPLRKMEKLGAPRLTNSGAVYVIVAQKKVHGMTQIPVNRFLSKRRLPVRTASPATRNNG